MNPEQLFHAALEAHQQENFPQAEAFYRQLLGIVPQHAHGQHYLGVLYHQLGQHQQAIEHIGNAIRLLPGNADQYNNLGLALRASGQLDAAIYQFQQALKWSPEDADIWQNLAVAQHHAGKLTAAKNAYTKALELAPKAPDIQVGLINTLEALGNVAHNAGSFAEAEGHFYKLIALQPDNASWHYNLGNALREQGKPSQAAESYQRALALNAEDADTYNNLGNVLRELQQLPESIACYQRALALNPKLYHARVHLVHQKQHICDWQGLDADIAEIRRWVNDTPTAQISPFAFIAMPGTTSQEQLTCAQQWTKNRHGHLMSETSRYKSELRFSPKLHIGYISCDFRLHPLASLITEMLELHDREHFQTSAYSYGINDGSQARLRIEQAVDNFVDIRALSLQEAAERIHADKVDILIDLTGYTQASRTGILALRPAPIQAAWLGFPGTMGAPFIDYLISDAVLTPLSEQKNYTEKLALLPNTYQSNDTQRLVSASPSREACGLPEDSFIYCCFNQSFKITSEIFACWMRLLLASPNSVLWLLESNSTASHNLRQAAYTQGVAPERLVFAQRVPLEQHLARHVHADLFLDTLPYNAHTTASDALWMGLPLITCRGETFASRVAASLLQAVGLAELVTSDLAAYEALALQLAQKPERLEQYRAQLRTARTNSALFNTQGFTHDVESLYRSMWQNRPI